MKPAILLCALLIVSAPAPARAGTVNFFWDDCVGNGGVSNRDFVNCASTTSSGVEAACGSFLLSQPMSDFVGIEFLIDLQTDATSMPAWWNFFPMAGACRGSALSATVDFSAFPNVQQACSDPFGTAGVGAFATYGIGSRFGGGLPLNRAYLVGAAAIPSAHALVAGTEYYGFRIALKKDKSNTSLAGSCVGCAEKVALGLHSLKAVGQAPESFETIQSPQTSNCITWQGAGVALCASTPARNRTWGSIKSLYR